MAKIIALPVAVPAQGDPPKVIEEFVGRAASGTAGVSIARMKSPAGWSEPGQTPDFDEYSLVLRGFLRVHTKETVLDVAAGQAVIAGRGEWVRYETPGEDGAEYVSVCLPAFSPAAAHRDE